MSYDGDPITQAIHDDPLIHSLFIDLDEWLGVVRRNLDKAYHMSCHIDLDDYQTLYYQARTPYEAVCEIIYTAIPF